MPQPDCPILLSGCPGVDSPITNTSAEAADTFQWAAQIWSSWDEYRDHKLGDGQDIKVDCSALAGEIFTNFDPIVFADTQAMANIIALGQSLGCPWNIPEVSGITLQNDAQSATVTCPDGSTFSYTVEAGLYQIDAAILCGYPTDTVTFVKSGSVDQSITHTGCFVQFTYDQLLGASTSSATWLCVDGHSITNSVGGGYVSAASQACAAWIQMANDWAQAEALYQATSLMDCITKDDPQAPGEDPPALTPGPGILTTPTWVCLGEEFFSSYNISGRGSASYTIEVISGTLPPGLTFTQTDPKRATLSGTTTTAGEYTFTIKGTATLAPYSVVQATVTVFVFGLVSDLLPDATANVAYSETLSADGGTAPYTFALDPDSDPLPIGLTLASDGTVSGTPTEDGDFVLTVAITDANGGVCVQDASLTVQPGGCPDFDDWTWTTNSTSTSGNGYYTQTISNASADLLNGVLSNLPANQSQTQLTGRTPFTISGCNVNLHFEFTRVGPTNRICGSVEVLYGTTIAGPWVSLYFADIHSIAVDGSFDVPVALPDPSGATWYLQYRIITQAECLGNNGLAQEIHLITSLSNI